MGRREVRKAKATAEAAERAELERRVQEEAPAAGEDGRARAGAATRFSELPLSARTQAGLRAAGYDRLTAVQAASIPHALAGRDVVGAARTGSGKTLCYVVPVLEALQRAGWQSGVEGDGLGALVVCPTRELALQVFQVLRRVGTRHAGLSAGLAIGGKDAAEEAERVGRMAVLVGTPGRLLAHLDRVGELRADDLRLLVLDEADRLLDSAFRSTMDALLAHLPPSSRRQTLLFSATQTTASLAQLSRLRLRAPERVSVHAESASATPARLRQSYCVVEAHRKLDFVFSFLRAHSRHKTLVFLSTCKQVKFVHAAFCHLHPGVPIHCLHGQLHQLKRMAIYDNFCRTRHAALFCTDVASRGLDFPQVDWVLQVDCPEDPTAYIHRVGRTARYSAGGRALLLLTPREAEGALPALRARHLPVEELRADPARLQPLADRLSALCAQDPALRHLAQRALATYLRSIHLHSDKRTFDVHSLDLPKLAASLGLPFAPQVRFSKSGHRAKNQSLAIQQLTAQLAARPDDSDSDSENDDSDSTLVVGRKRRTSATAATAAKKSRSKRGKAGKAMEADQEEEEEEEEDDDLLVITKRHDPAAPSDLPPPIKKKKNRRRGKKKKTDQ
jgi:ATP-dependent RNA helicase DDX10/DBP4